MKLAFSGASLIYCTQCTVLVCVGTPDTDTEVEIEVLANVMAVASGYTHIYTCTSVTVMIKI